MYYGCCCAVVQTVRRAGCERVIGFVGKDSFSYVIALSMLKLPKWFIRGDLVMGRFSDGAPAFKVSTIIRYSEIY